VLPVTKVAQQLQPVDWHVVLSQQSHRAAQMYVNVITIGG
jgi:hypothetical protein